MPIIDSSALVSFAKIKALRLLKSLRAKMTTIPELYEECVEKGIALGYPDALKIKKLFDEKAITLETAKIFKKISGVSGTDSKTIHLARETKEALFVDDTKLGRRAKAEEIEVWNTADILLHLLKTKKINKTEYAGLLQELVRNKRMTEQTRAAYEKTAGGD
jgi:predicted nucleic acid-binding protein